LNVDKLNIESKVDKEDEIKKSSYKDLLKSGSKKEIIHNEENSVGSLHVKNQGIIKGDVNLVGSNLVLGDNSFVAGKVTTDSRELNSTYSYKESKKGFSSSIGSSGFSIGYGKTESKLKEKDLTNAKSNLVLGDNITLNKGAEITATNFTHGKVSINNGDVKFGARKDTKDVETSTNSSGLNLSVKIKSEAVDRAKQGIDSVNQMKSGDILGGLASATNTVTGVVSGLASNQGTKLPTSAVNADNTVGKDNLKAAQATNNFYADAGVNFGYTKSSSKINSHNESAVVTTIKGKDENSSITYNNVKNIEYVGTQAQDTKFIYNNVENINKRAVELKNSYSSSSTSSGISTGVTIGYGDGTQTSVDAVKVSASQSKMNSNGTSGITSIGVNYSDRKQEGITKNTVIGDVEIGKSSGDEINRDLDTMTEITEDRDFKTDINVESQTINYIKNPEKFKEDLQKAKNEIHDIYHAVDSTVNLQGKETRSPLEQLGEVRQAKTIYNVIDSRLQEAENQEDIAKAFEGASEDLGYKVKVIYTDPSNSPQLIGVDKKGNTYIKDGTAYVDKDTGIGYILVNTESAANSTKAGVIGTIAEEQSHIIGKKEGRQKVVPDGSEKGLESLGKPTNDYFKKQYSKNDKVIGIKSDGKDYSNVDFGENVGDKKNEGWDIYTKDIRKEKQPNGKYYTEKEMQDNINNVFGKGKFDIDWKEYEDNEKYRTQSNYYYFQAKYTLKSNKVNEITDDYIIIQNNDKNIKLNIVPPEESLYHNVEYNFKNNTFGIYFNNKNKKYTNEDGYEVVIDENNKIVTDPGNRGTYNMVTYESIFSEDAYLHAKIDMNLWGMFGTGPDDKSTKEVRERLGGIIFGANITLFYDILKIESMKKTQNKLSEEEINKKIHEIYFSNERENSGY